MSHIFISYSRKDIDFASRVVQALAENQLDTWIDWKSIPKGEDWEQEIYCGIEEADAFLFLISPDSVRNSMCNKEIEHAVRNGKRILPILVHNTDPKGIHPEISKLNWIDCRYCQDDFSSAIEDIRKTIHSNYDWLRYHTELQKKALRWDQKKDNSWLLSGKELKEAEQQSAELGNQEELPLTRLQWKFIVTSRRNVKRIYSMVTIGLVAAVALSIFAVMQRKQSKHQTEIALARQLVTKAIDISENSQRTNDSVRLMSLYAVEAAYRIPGLETDTILRKVLSFTAMPLTEISNDGFSMNDMALSQNDKWIAVAEDNTVRVYEFATGKEISRMTHGDEVYSVNFNPDSTVVASASEDGTARVWDVQSGVEISRMNYERWAGRAFFSSDGHWILSWGDNSVRLWDPNTGLEIARLDHETNVYAAVLSRDKTMVVSVADGGDLIAWDPVTGNIYNKIDLETDASIHQSMIGLSHDDKYFVIRLNNSLEIWNTATWKKLNTIASFDAYTFALSPVNNWVVTGNGMGLGQVWDLSTGTRIAAFNQGYQYTMMVFSPDGQWIATACDCGYVKIWNATTWQEASFMSHNQIVDIYDAAFTSDGTKLISVGSHFDAIRTWNIEVKSGETLRQSFGERAESISFSPDERYILATGCGNYELGEGCWEDATAIWDAKTGEEILSVSYDVDVPVAFFSRDSQLVITTSCPEWPTIFPCADTIHVLDLRRGKEIQQYQYSGNILSASLSYDNKHIYVVGCEGELEDNCERTVKVWNIDTGFEGILDLPVESADFIKADSDSEYLIIGQCERRDENDHCANELIIVWDPIHGAEIAHMAQVGRVDDASFDLGGNFVLINSCVEVDQNSDCSKRLGVFWDLQTGREVSRFSTAGNINMVHFFDNSKKVIFGNADSIVILDVSTGKKITTFQEWERHEPFSISPNGSALAIGQSYWVTVIDVATKEFITRFRHDNTIGSALMPVRVRAVTFSPDGTRVVSGGEDQTVRVWIWDPEELISQICHRITGNFTHAEWNFLFKNEPYRRTCTNLP